MCHEINKLLALNQIGLIALAECNGDVALNQSISGFEWIFNGSFFEKQSRNVL